MKCENKSLPGCAPGTVVARTGGGSAFAQFEQLISMTDGLSLGQVCAITGLEPSSVQNWVKRGFVPRPVGKKYHGRQLARIMLINALRGGLQIESIDTLMHAVNGDVNDESDDIVSEEKFYDYLCAAFEKCAPDMLCGDVRTGVEQAISDYSGDTEAKRRLTDALCAMVSAYAAGILTKKANDHLLELTGGKDNE